MQCTKLTSYTMYNSYSLASWKHHSDTSRPLLAWPVQTFESPLEGMTTVPCSTPVHQAPCSHWVSTHACISIPTCAICLNNMLWTVHGYAVWSPPPLKKQLPKPFSLTAVFSRQQGWVWLWVCRNVLLQYTLLHSGHLIVSQGWPLYTQVSLSSTTFSY